jgi:hypothetical protein
MELSRSHCSPCRILCSAGREQKNEVVQRGDRPAIYSLHNAEAITFPPILAFWLSSYSGAAMGTELTPSGRHSQALLQTVAMRWISPESSGVECYLQIHASSTLEIGPRRLRE